MNKILLVVHQQSSNPGLVGQAFKQFGYTLDIRTPALGDSLPTTLDQHEAVVIFGGPMSANDEHLPFIRTELDWIPVALESGKPFLGICLGAQLLARVLGAKVAPHPQKLTEIGYFPIFPTGNQAYFDSPRSVYHWHREGFQLPTGAVQLATSEIYENQAFCYGERAYGVQFHPEITTEMIETWTTKGAEMLSLPGAQPRVAHFRAHERHSQVSETWLQDFLSFWLELSEPELLSA